MAFSLSNLFNVTDSPAFALDGAIGLVTGKGVGQNLLFVTGDNDDGITSFKITKSGHLKKVQVLYDATHPTFEFDGAIGLTKVKVGTRSFILATGENDDGISSFEINKKNGHLINRDNVTDAGALKLHGAADVLTAKVGGATFAVVAGPGAGENGLSVFQVHANGTLTNTDNVTDGGALELFAPPATWPRRPSMAPLI